MHYTWLYGGNNDTMSFKCVQPMATLFTDTSWAVHNQCSEVTTIAFNCIM